MASLVKRGSKWYVKFIDHNGKQKMVKGFSDKAMTERLARTLEDEAHAIRIGAVDPQVEARRVERCKSLAHHVSSFESHLRSKARNPKYISYTIKDVQRCISHAGIQVAGQLTVPMLDAWRTFCRDTGYAEHHYPDGTPIPDSRKTANRRIASVRAFLRYLHRIGGVGQVVTEGYPMLDTEGHETFQRRALSLNECKQLIERTADHDRRELYRFAIYTGFRRSEIASMRPSSLNFERLTITVIASDAKYKGQHQTIPMHRQLVDPLKRLCEGKTASQRLFRFPPEKEIVNLLCQDCVAAGVVTDSVDFHALRHTFITLLAEQNIRPEVLKKLARHRNLATTMRYYVHFRPDDEHQAVNRIG